MWPHSQWIILSTKVLGLANLEQATCSRTVRWRSLLAGEHTTVNWRYTSVYCLIKDLLVLWYWTGSTRHFYSLFTPRPAQPSLFVSHNSMVKPVWVAYSCCSFSSLFVIRSVTCIDDMITTWISHKVHIHTWNEEPRCTYQAGFQFNCYGMATFILAEPPFIWFHRHCSLGRGGWCMVPTGTRGIGRRSQHPTFIPCPRIWIPRDDNLRYVSILTARLNYNSSCSQRSGNWPSS